MKQPIHLRVPCRRWPATAALCCFAFAGLAPAQTTPAPTTPDPAPQPSTQSQSQSQPAAEGTQGKHQVRAAQDAYAAGAKRLEHDDMAGAERDFAHALALDPGNTGYALAVSVAREHRLTELVQQSGKARLAGDPARAETLLAEARAIDPANPIVIQHSIPALVQAAQTPATPARNSKDQDLPITPLTDRAQLLSTGFGDQPWKPAMPSLAGPLQLKPTATNRDFHLRGNTQDVLRQVADAYGIRASFDDSVERKELRFDLEGVDYKQAMAIAMKMTHVFAVPIDETSVLIAKDDSTNRLRLERLMEETIFVPGLTTEQIQELGNVLHTVFGIKDAIVQASLQTIVVRAPADVLGPMNRTIQDLIDGGGEVMLEVKLYEVDTTRMRNIGATIPTQAGIYNVEAAATQIVNANQTLVQQAIAQGFVPATASNIEIALALIGSGLVQSSLLSSTVGFFGHGLTQTGITASTNTSFSLALNSSDTRTLDDVQMQLADHQPGTFRAGTKYPIVTSTYSTGVASAASSLGNTQINGVSVASLLAQFSGGASATIPQVTYADLGVTLKATPIMQKSGRINLTLDMKIEALAGGTLNGNPILASHQISSDITVADGESAMMVSNLTRNETAAVAGIPGLSELPGFEAPVDQNAEKDTGQLVVLVTPHVIRRRSNMIAGPRIVVRALDAQAAN
jgi:general secretion pathway protein D